MIVFEKIRWKNLLSTGNQFTEVSLNSETTTLIIGTNGSGKSTILDALCFSLFNKSFRKINKAQLINTSNEKDCVVEVEFSIGSKKYEIVRGMKPNKFEIWLNGKLQDQFSNAADQQKYLEQNILKLNYKSFTQIVILGSSNFVPFMQLNPASRREVIEDLLDIRIFSHMNSATKERIRDTRDSISQLSINKSNFKDKIEMQKEFIESIESATDANITSNRNTILELENSISEYSENNDSLNLVVDKLKEKLEEVSGSSDKLRKLGNLKGKLSTKISSIIKEHKFFNENTVCPTCDQNIEESFRLNRIEDSQNKAKELQTGFNELEDAIEKEELRESTFKSISGDITNKLNEISQNNTAISGLRRQIQQQESEIQRIITQRKNRTSEDDKLNELEIKYKEIEAEFYKEKEYSNNLELIHQLLKDDGVKTKIVKKYLPIINNQINRYLQLMDFYINFKLDEEFNESVDSPIHDDFSYSSFSEGEKMRIDLALLFTWREIAKIKNSSSTNLLIMDEVFDSSLDTYGTEEFMKIIRYVVKNANIFVISHKNDLYDKFDSVLKFDKIKGFSSVV
jgi:DNA repair exonuclease SbcCD ATPase subunit